MLSTNDAAKVFDTILCTPGMSENVRIDVKISRKSILLLNSVIERGLTVTDTEKASLLSSFPEDTFSELTAFAEECLKKSNLSSLHEKLKGLSSK
jgi:hypothetical protein